MRTLLQMMAADTFFRVEKRLRADISQNHLLANVVRQQIAGEQRVICADIRAQRTRLVQLRGEG